MRSSRSRSRCWNAASSRYRTTSGNASPTLAATMRQIVHTTSRPVYGRTRGSSAASGAGETGFRDRVTTLAASGV